MQSLKPTDLSRIKFYTACFTALSFTFTSIVFPSALHAAPEVSSKSVVLQDFSTLKIPESMAKVETVFHGDEKAGRSVIVIQDAHSIPDAQRSIRKTILFLEKAYGAKLVGVEGASGDFDTRIFQSYPDQEGLQKVFKDYMDKGEMTGSVAAAIFGLKKEMTARGVEFFGIEDWPVYEDGLALYLAAMGQEEKITKQLDVRSGKLEGEKGKAYSKELLDVDAAQVEFEGNSKDLLAYLKTLAAVKAPEAGSEIALLLNEADKGQADESALDAEVRKLAAKLKTNIGRLSAEGQKTFSEKYQAYQTSQLSAAQFALVLKDLSEKEGFKLAMSQGMAHQAFNQRRMRDLEGTKLFKDIEAYTKGIKESLFRNDIERQLDQQTHELILLKKWAKLELSREDWAEIKKQLEVRSGTLEDGAKIDALSLQTSNAELPTIFKYNKAFYENAEKRDAAFIKNLEKRLKPGEPAIMIAGGFHAQGLAEHLQAKGIDYALVMPNIVKLPEVSAYREHMKGNVDWKSYFEVKNGKINLYEAFVRYTRDQLLNVPGTVPKDPRLLKNWRDQIIRNLADEGKLAKAGEYTRFIDETLTDKKKKDIEARMQDVENFITGLKDLDEKGQFTASNIAKLLQPANSKSTIGAVLTSPGTVDPNQSVRPEVRVESLGESLPTMDLAVRLEVRAAVDERVKAEIVKDLKGTTFEVAPEFAQRDATPTVVLAGERFSEILTAAIGGKVAGKAQTDALLKALRDSLTIELKPGSRGAQEAPLNETYRIVVAKPATKQAQALGSDDQQVVQTIAKSLLKEGFTADDEYGVRDATPLSAIAAGNFTSKLRAAMTTAGIKGTARRNSFLRALKERLSYEDTGRPEGLTHIYKITKRSEVRNSLAAFPNLERDYNYKDTLGVGVILAEQAQVFSRLEELGPDEPGAYSRIEGNRRDISIQDQNAAADQAERDRLRGQLREIDSRLRSLEGYARSEVRVVKSLLSATSETFADFQKTVPSEAVVVNLVPDTTAVTVEDAGKLIGDRKDLNFVLLDEAGQMKLYVIANDRVKKELSAVPTGISADVAEAEALKQATAWVDSHVAQNSWLQAFKGYKYEALVRRAQVRFMYSVKVDAALEAFKNETQGVTEGFTDAHLGVIYAALDELTVGGLSDVHPNLLETIRGLIGQVYNQFIEPNSTLENKQRILTTAVSNALSKVHDGYHASQKGKSDYVQYTKEMHEAVYTALQAELAAIKKETEAKEGRVLTDEETAKLGMTHAKAAKEGLLTLDGFLDPSKKWQIKLEHFKSTEAVAIIQKAFEAAGVAESDYGKKVINTLNNDYEDLANLEVTAAAWTSEKRRSYLAGLQITALKEVLMVLNNTVLIKALINAASTEELASAVQEISVTISTAHRALEALSMINLVWRDGNAWDGLAELPFRAKVNADDAANLGIDIIMKDADVFLSVIPLLLNAGNAIRYDGMTKIGENLQALAPHWARLSEIFKSEGEENKAVFAQALANRNQQEARSEVRTNDIRILTPAEALQFSDQETYPLLSSADAMARDSFAGMLQFALGGARSDGKKNVLVEVKRGDSRKGYVVGSELSDYGPLTNLIYKTGLEAPDITFKKIDPATLPLVARAEVRWTGEDVLNVLSGSKAITSMQELSNLLQSFSGSSSLRKTGPVSIYFSPNTETNLKMVITPQVADKEGAFTVSFYMATGEVDRNSNTLYEASPKRTLEIKVSRTDETLVAQLYNRYVYGSLHDSEAWTELLSAISRSEVPSAVDEVAEGAVQVIFSGDVSSIPVVSSEIEVLGHAQLQALVAALKAAAQSEIARQAAQTPESTALTYSAADAARDINLLDDMAAEFFEAHPDLVGRGLVFNVKGEESTFSRALEGKGLVSRLTTIFAARGVDVGLLDLGVNTVPVGDLNRFADGRRLDNGSGMAVVGDDPVTNPRLFLSKSEGKEALENEPYKREVDLYARALFGVLLSMVIDSANQLNNAANHTSILGSLLRILPADISESVKNGLFKLDVNSLTTQRDLLFSGLLTELRTRSEVGKAA